MGGGSTNGGSASSSMSSAGEYALSKTSVWWDIENCHVPKGCDPHSIAQNISMALQNMDYRGPLTISAYGDTYKIPAAVQHALSSTGIALNHVPAGVKDASHKKILVDMLFWAVDNPAPANYLLISGDRDFSNALHQLRLRRYNILLAQPQNVSAPLVAAAKNVWLWTSLVGGGPPLSNCDSSPPGNGSTTNAEFRPVNSDNPHFGSQKSYGDGRADNKHKVKQPWRNLSQPNLTRSSSSEFRQPSGGTQEGFTTGNYDRTNPIWRPAVSQTPMSASGPCSTEYVENAYPNFTGANSAVSHPPPVNLPTSGYNMPQRPPSTFGFPPQSVYMPGKPFNEAPHKFFSDNTAKTTAASTPNVGPPRPDLLRNNGGPIPGYMKNLYPLQPLRPSDIVTAQPTYVSGNLGPPYSSVNGSQPLPHMPDGQTFTSCPPASVPDMRRLNLSEWPVGVQNVSAFPPNLPPFFPSPHPPSGQYPGGPDYQTPPQPAMGEAPRPPSGQYPRGPEYQTPPQPAMGEAPRPPSGQYPRGPEYQTPPQPAMGEATARGQWAASGNSQPSNHDLGLAGTILLALDSLKEEMIVPTEANVADCIHYGELNQPNFDVKKALSHALELQLIVMHSAGGALQVYIPKDKKLWQCVNPINTNIKKGKQRCEAVKKFITSVGGRAAMMASPCRYKAAAILKSTCLTGSTLGEVFQILHTIITVKKWVIPHPSGWQPLTINVFDTGIDSAT
ncbi:hypothetical protein H6P81_004452 [Aristolochia fimbriata]|uniref:NYN domain-containing protein n=1 Tax=Aristolochia fimbriata TaxID=158543 RepID=A0AAV7FFY5_ARIFI|nr:hypothetical protein H6P81_004452 [Aristolochia fimbriata]